MELGVRMSDLGILWAAAFGGLLLTVVGLAAYGGRFRSMWLRLWPRTTLAFGMLWLGVAGILLGLGNPVMDQPWAVAVIGVPAVVCGVIGILSILWMPRSLQPQWFRDMPLEVRRVWRP